MEAERRYFSADKLCSAKNQYIQLFNLLTAKVIERKIGKQPVYNDNNNIDRRAWTRPVEQTTLQMTKDTKNEYSFRTALNAFSLLLRRRCRSLVRSLREHQQK